MIFVDKLALQWGRAQMSAEMAAPRGAEKVYLMLQWGRAQMSAEMPLLRASATSVLGFNGAALR